jgi:hypothetical protein
VWARGQYPRCPYAHKRRKIGQVVPFSRTAVLQIAGGGSKAHPVHRLTPQTKGVSHSQTHLNGLWGNRLSCEASNLAIWVQIPAIRYKELPYSRSNDSAPSRQRRECKSRWEHLGLSPSWNGNGLLIRNKLGSRPSSPIKSKVL